MTSSLFNWSNFFDSSSINSQVSDNKNYQTQIISPSLIKEQNKIISTFEYKQNKIKIIDNKLEIQPQKIQYKFKTELKPRKTGLLLVGIGGNNGSTVVGAITANKKNLSWRTRNGIKKSNYYGSVTQSTTIHIGYDGENQVYVPFNSVLPLVDPNSLIIDGWDINNSNLYKAMLTAKVFEPELIDKLEPFLKEIVPKPSIYYPDFIASNQKDRVNNIISETTKFKQLEHIRNDIREFKSKNNLECVIVLWTANTERYTEVKDGLNKTAYEILKSIENDAKEISPSNIFAVASILEGAFYINGSPQNTLVPGIIELAQKHNVFIAGDDFKTGQTKIKSALVEFLISSGLKLESIASYNHLGNNDGKNLSEQKQFRSKEISKSSVIDDIVNSNCLLYEKEEKPDHVIVIKYMPYVGDSKRAMDEYICSIFMGGQQTIAIHNTCEDSLLAAPIIIDLAILTELFSRITYTISNDKDYESFDSVLSLLSLLLKAPVVPEGTPVINAFMKQLNAIKKLITICAGIYSDNDLQLEFFTKTPKN